MTTSFMENWRPQGMPLSTLCSCAGIACPPHLAQLMIKGITADSRRVKEGWLFVALKGYTKNGEDFILDACQRGAILCVAEESPKTDPLVPVLLVSNAREALAYLCDAWYDHPSEKFRMVGVTGTNGKTSVCAMLAHILKSAGVPCGVIGTLGCISPQGHKLAVTPSVSTAHMTTPDPEELYLALALMAQEVESQEGVVVMEVTSHALALCKTDPINFEVGIFTNLTPEHLDFHGDMENYFNAKAKLFSATRKAVINAQDAYGKRLVSLPSSVVERYDLCYADDTTIHEEMGAGVCCRRIYAGQVTYMGLDGVEYRLITPHARLRVQCPVPGEFTLKNSMQAVAAALALGLPPSQIQKAVANFPGVLGRMERVHLPTYVGFAVFLDYAHTPDALEHLLLTANRLKRLGQRVVLLFGCGGDRDPSKRAVMAKIASRLADKVIVTSDNSRSEDPDHIISQILTGMDKECDHVVISRREDAIHHAIKYARRGDIILLAGKGHETYEVDKDGQHPFCERDIVLEAVGRYHPFQI